MITVINMGKSGWTFNKEENCFVSGKGLKFGTEIEGGFELDEKKDVNQLAMTSHVVYNDKQFLPILCACDERRDASIAIVHIGIEDGYKLTSFYNNRATVYARKYDAEAGTLDFVANMSLRRGRKGEDEKASQPRINITLVDETGKRYITYSFMQDNKYEGFVRFVKHGGATRDIPAKGTRGHVNLTNFIDIAIQRGKEPIPVFVPGASTKVVICASKNAINPVRRVYQHNHRLGDPKRMIFITPDEIDEYLEKGYTAFTEALNIELGKVKDEDVEDYVKKAQIYKFNVFHRVGKDGVVRRVKNLNVR